ncbi:hypothetical protein NM688_g1221 [Phlebia brevispora]|uniref:Uncharacterized protein n=1 Tax=Phlebia brevispora TaxID=194682 RepID=A0ACC1TC43_9APHY|nr:hypothetical protein NM688_g1221 [Phlebia brevispora]
MTAKNASKSRPYCLRSSQRFIFLHAAFRGGHTTKSTALQELAEQGATGALSVDELRERCEELEATPGEVSDVLAEAEQRLRIDNGGAERQDLSQRTEIERAAHGSRSVRQDEAEEVLTQEDVHRERSDEEKLAEKLFEAKLRALLDDNRELDTSVFGALDRLVEDHPPSIPASILAVAPHLADLNKVALDPLVQKTVDIRRAFVSDKQVSSVVDVLVLQDLQQPLPRAIWKDVVLDRYVEFDKVHAALDPAYDHGDDVKDFIAGFGIVKKDSFNARKPVTSEAEWLRVFDAWFRAVISVYPHRSSELLVYLSTIQELFRAAPNDAGIAIRTDAHVRHQYSQHPFRLDSPERIHIPVLSQILASARFPSQSATSSRGTKRPSDTATFSYSKKSSVPCQNWNMGRVSILIEPPTTPTVSPHSSVDAELELNIANEQAVRATQTRSLPSTVRTAPYPSDLPRFRRGFAWRDSSSSTTRHLSPAALDTEVAEPLPMPPPALLTDPDVQASLKFYADAIQVDTPFNVDRFESLLATHPNRPFVESVIWSLRNGFWPCDESEWKAELHDDVSNYSMDEPDLNALRTYRDEAIQLGRWSLPIPLLLPYMKISPMFVVWQHGKARIVTDHTASGLNDGIPRDKAHVRYDNMQDFGQVMHDLRRAEPTTTFTLWKSDVSSAFLNLPAHPLWQLRQVVVVDGHMHIVRRLVFGNRLSPRCWCAVSGLIAWITAVILHIPDVHVYMDDFWGWDREDHAVIFHGTLRPLRQVHLLLFWNYICCPYKDVKQESGSPLKIIGFWVDINLGSITVTPAAITEAVAAINTFLSTPHRKPVLREWQRLAGHLNWILNVFPWGRPALTEVYRKMAGKTRQCAPLFLNREVVAALTWFKELLPHAVGVSFATDGRWVDHEAELTVFCDASPAGLGFVYNRSAFSYALRPPTDSTPQPDIFFLEELAVISALAHLTSLTSPPKRILVYSDSLDTVQAFYSLHVTDSLHNAPLLAAATIICTSGIDPRVHHIPGLLRGRLTDTRRAHAPPASLHDLDERVAFLQGRAIERSTQKGYLTGARDYVCFCLQHHLPLTPTPRTLARYIAYTSRFIASGPKYLTGARHFLTDFFPFFEASRRSAFVQATIRGSRKVRADPIKRKLPLRLRHLAAFHDLALTSSAYDDLLFVTILACAVYACHRIGELVCSNDHSLWDWRKIIKRASLTFSHNRASYVLPYHKNDPFYHGTLITHTSQDVANPVALLQLYVARRDRIHGARAALFLRADGTHPNRSWFERRFHSLLGKEYGGHSARAGGATFYASLGLSEDVIQALGRWSSTTWKDYVRENPAVRAALQLAALRKPSQPASRSHLLSPPPSPTHTHS